MYYAVGRLFAQKSSVVRYFDFLKSSQEDAKEIVFILRDNVFGVGFNLVVGFVKESFDFVFAFLVFFR